MKLTKTMSIGGPPFSMIFRPRASEWLHITVGNSSRLVRCELDAPGTFYVIRWSVIRHRLVSLFPSMILFES